MGDSEIGLIGLAVMGQNLARNISRNFRISVYNRTCSVTQTFARQYGHANLLAFEHLSDFIHSLKKPRKVAIMVKAGEAVDKVIATLLPLLDADDVIIDFGNSNYIDTIRREKELQQQNIHFFGCGVSGGEEGALHGPSLMPGGKQSIYKRLQPILQAIAARDFHQQPCVSYMGENGAGHFVKMVHNGIEYGVMQMMAEAYELLSRGMQLPADQISDIFNRFNQGKLHSYLFEIAVPILAKKDPLSDDFLINRVVDAAGQKGTGRWTAIESLRLGTPLSVITEAVYARVISADRSQRQRLAKLYQKKQPNVEVPLQSLIPQLENSLYAAILISYAQGFRMFELAEQEHNWHLNFPEIARIWQGGCIIRADILETLERAFRQGENKSLLEINEIVQVLGENIDDLRAIVSLATAHGIALFSLSTALASFEAMTNERTSANLLQGLRDSFGAHTFLRTDQEGTFHADWSENGKLERLKP